MELSEALNNRKSTRHYIDKNIEKSLLDEMLSAANLAPSWKNSQTPRFYVATGEKSKNAVREALPEFNRKKFRKCVRIYRDNSCSQSFGF